MSSVYDLCDGIVSLLRFVPSHLPMSATLTQQIYLNMKAIHRHFLISPVNQRSMFTVWTCLCLVMICWWLPNPCPSGLLHHTIQPYDLPSAIVATLKAMGRYTILISLERRNSHNKIKQSKIARLFMGQNCTLFCIGPLPRCDSTISSTATICQRNYFGWSNGWLGRFNIR